jgi:group I intron endonuclease
MNFSIYIIQNKLNNKLYVGKSNDVEVRWGYHKKVATGRKELYPNDFSAIHGALAKYGFENFSWLVIEEFELEKDCFVAETFWIQFFRSWDRNIWI